VVQVNKILQAWRFYRDQVLVNSLRNGGDSDKEQIENNLKDPENGFWDKNNSEGILSN